MVADSKLLPLTDEHVLYSAASPELNGNSRSARPPSRDACYRILGWPLAAGFERLGRPGHQSRDS